MKIYNLKYNVGSVKYLISFHDGKKLHKDKSPFFDIRTFKNKTKCRNFIKNLELQGYKHKF